MRSSRKIMILAVAAAAGTAFSACSPSLEQPSDLPPGVEITPSVVPAASPSEENDGHAEQDEQAAEECAAEDIQVTGAAGQAPRVTLPQDCPAPTTLVTADLTEGTGPAAADGSTVEIEYQVVAWSDGAVKQGTFGQQGEPLSLTLGETQQDAGGFQGWSEALEGIHEGSRRVIVFPAEHGPDSGELAEETLVVVADAVSVSDQ